MRFKVNVRELRWMGKPYKEGDQFDADETNRDIKVLLAIKRIEEVPQTAQKASEPKAAARARAPAPEPTEAPAPAAPSAPVVNVTDEGENKPRYVRRDLRAEE